MGYNPFRWYTKGSYRKKPLPKKSPLLLKIQNGDFEYSPFLLESKDEERNYQKKYDDFMKKSLIQDINKKIKTTIIMISHRENPFKICDKIYQIKDNKLDKIK